MTAVRPTDAGVDLRRPLGSARGWRRSRRRRRDGPSARLAATTVAVAPSTRSRLFAAAVEAGLEAALWLRPSEGTAFVGVGRAWAIEPDGPDRFADAEAAWRGLLGARRGSTATPTAAASGPCCWAASGSSGRGPDPATPGRRSAPPRSCCPGCCSP